MQISLKQGDLLQPFAGEKADCVVCNPPYVAEKEYEQLDPQVKNFEPRQALVAGPTGLEYYARLARALPPHLQPKAHIWMEMGTGQGDKILNLFQMPPWKQARVEKDWAGHDRFFFLEIE